MPSNNKTPQQLIKEYLDRRAAEDPQFAEKYRNEKKSLKECWAFIVGEASARRSGNCCCMSDDEVFGLAVHYYDEDKIKIRTVSGVRTSTSAKKEAPKKEADTKTKPEKKSKTSGKAKTSGKSNPDKKSTKAEAAPKRRVIQLELFDFND